MLSPLTEIPIRRVGFRALRVTLRLLTRAHVLWAHAWGGARFRFEAECPFPLHGSSLIESRVRTVAPRCAYVRVRSKVLKRRHCVTYRTERILPYSLAVWSSSRRWRGSGNAPTGALPLGGWRL